MAREERLAYITRRLNEEARVTEQSLVEALQVHRATIYRDLELLRSRLQAPIEWDAASRSYRLTQRQGPGAKFIVPGLWMDAETLYGMLVVLNLAAAMDPGVVGSYRREFGRLLKITMSEHHIEPRRLDEKITVELPQPPAAAQAAMKVIGPALVLDASVRLFASGWPAGGALVTPTGLRLRPDGWWLEVTLDVDGRPRALPLADVLRAEPAGRADMPPPEPVARPATRRR